MFNSQTFNPPPAEDQNYLQPLITSHFLISGPLRTIPELPVSDVEETYASKYKHAQLMLQ